MTQMDAREQRLASNEVIFRDVNERIDQAAAPHGRHDGHVFEFLCECSNIDCTLRLPLSLATYEEIRSNPVRFVVAPGHELPEIEAVVFRGDGYQIVTKEGAAAAIVAAQDPRS